LSRMRGIDAANRQRVAIRGNKSNTVNHDQPALKRGLEGR
jgi:hypothetical protein